MEMKPHVGALPVALLLPVLFGASGARVPAPMLGTWAHGECSAAADRLVVAPSSAALGTGRPAATYYDADAGGAHAALHWNKKYVVDNFQYIPETDVIVHNTQGFGMPGAIVYKRCPAKSVK